MGLHDDMVPDFLVEYGVEQWTCTHVVHVSARFIYSVPHDVAVRHVRQHRENGCYKSKAARASNGWGITAWGVLVPWRGLDGLVRREIPPDLRGLALWEKSTEKEKGACAEAIARAMCVQEAEPVRDEWLQRRGHDLVSTDFAIEVKCDLPADETGNLYMQTHERRA